LNGEPWHSRWDGGDRPAGGYLLGHVVRFGQLLRVMGVDVSSSQVLDLAQALDHISISNRDEFYTACRALLIGRREDFLVFDQAFQYFWQSEPEGADPVSPPPGTKLKLMRLPARHARSRGQGVDDDRDAEGESPEPGEQQEKGLPRAQMIYGAQEVLRTKDFGEMSWEEIQAARRTISQLEWRLGERRTRRSRLSPKGRLYLRHVVRDNLRFGGEPLVLTFRRRATRPRPLVVLCDISGSMERYSRMLLHFIHALTHGLVDTQVEAFVFGTRLTRITRHLRHRDVDESLDELGQAVRDWSGGTRIGETLKTFNYHWARRVLGSGAVVLIISDGWDRGNIDLLTHEIGRLQRSAYRLMWLNPLLGSADYRPVQQGMAAVLPCVDDFLPVHNLGSLEQLARTLSAVATQRPARKQHVCGRRPQLRAPRLGRPVQPGIPEWLRNLPDMHKPYGGLG